MNWAWRASLVTCRTGCSSVNGFHWNTKAKAISISDTDCKHITRRRSQSDVVHDDGDVECILNGNAVRRVAVWTALYVSRIKQHLTAVIHQRPSMEHNIQSIRLHHCHVIITTNRLTRITLSDVEETTPQGPLHSDLQESQIQHGKDWWKLEQLSSWEPDCNSLAKPEETLTSTAINWVHNGSKHSQRKPSQTWRAAIKEDSNQWFTSPQTVTHPSTEWARRWVSTLIETNALQLSHATTRDDNV